MCALEFNTEINEQHQDSRVSHNIHHLIFTDAGSAIIRIRGHCKASDSNGVPFLPRSPTPPRLVEIQVVALR